MTKSITIDNRPVKRVMIGDGLYWEDKPKRFAYYFNGSATSTAYIGRGMQVGESWLHSAEIEFKLLETSGRLFSRIEVKPNYLRVMTDVSKDIQVPITIGEKHTLRIDYENGGIWRVYLDGAYVCEHSDNENKNVILQWVGNTGYGQVNPCNCYIYGINGRNLEDFPDFIPYNVTRYELDDNDNIIPSTAKVINTDDN